MPPENLVIKYDMEKFPVDETGEPSKELIKELESVIGQFRIELHNAKRASLAITANGNSSNVIQKINGIKSVRSDMQYDADSNI